MTHNHTYSYWHAHEHTHSEFIKGHWLPGPAKIHIESKLTVSKHSSGHHHFYSNTHEHGKQSNMIPHSHKDKQYHPNDNDKVIKHHHAVADHEEKEEK